MNSSTNVKIVDGTWKDRIDRALKHVSRMIDLRQRRDAVPLLKSISQQVEEKHRSRPLKILSISNVVEEKKSCLYKTFSVDESTNEKLICSMSILPQVDPLPSMFTYVSLQSNFLCDTMTDLSDLILEQDDEDVKNLLNSVQSEPIVQQQTNQRNSPNSSSKRIRRSSKSLAFNDRNNEFLFDEEHLIELLKRLKQQQTSGFTSEDESNLFETMIAIYPSSGDLIREKFGTIFETKRVPAKEFTPNIDHPSLALDTTVENTLHSYFMLFCRRCHRYDCFLHKDKQATPDLKRSKKNFDVNYRPCGSQCYLIKSHLSCQTQKRTKIELKRSHSELVESSFKSTNNDSFSKRIKSQIFKNEIHSSTSIFKTNFTQNAFIFKPIIKRKLTEDFSDWSASDKSLFRVFSKIYSDNICMIADLLDKTCLQVYQFYLNEIQSSNLNGYTHRQISSVSSLSDFTSSTSSDSNELKANGEQSNSEETNLSNHHRSSSRRSHFSTFRRQRSHQHLLINHLNTLNAEKKRHTYYPCEHDPSISCNEECYCVRSNNFCEKYCCCSSTKCDNRFPGCRCRSSCTTKQCPCYAAGRECDPDLCTQCGADDFRSTNSHQDFQTKTVCSCHNVAIQRSLHKPLLLAESDVAGWGIFTQVNIQRNEFIAEYCGEILTQDEGEIRGRMYDSIGTSFLFDLNEEYMVDATRRGNKIRFANHSINPNCYAKVIMVNGDHRIGIYSKRFIAAGDELFFDYRYGANHHLRFVGVEKAHVQDPIDP